MTLSKRQSSTAVEPSAVHRQSDNAHESKSATQGNNAESTSDDTSDESQVDSEKAAEAATGKEDDDEPARPRKRRKRGQMEDLEGLYMSRLAREEAKEEHQRQAKRRAGSGKPRQAEEKIVDTTLDESSDSSGESADDVGSVPQHEALAGLDASSAMDKAPRTVFLSNVSTTAIKSKSAKKVLLAHLSSFLQTMPKHDPPHKIESIRFRSTAFASGVGPKKAAYAKKELMDDTTSSTNAYAVYSNEKAARTAASKLNGSIVLDRHLRVDYAAQPAVIDHRRCVFVGNLSFVDKESTEANNEGAESKARRSKAKEPADAEEGLWRTFSKAGKVESVRVVRDKETRVGKGFAYIQFQDENGVEEALQYNDKKFPPMLPRKLRVMRAKRPKQAMANHRKNSDDMGFNLASRNASSSTRNGQASTQARLHGRNSRQDGFGKSKSFVFEGHRASSTGNSNSGTLKSRKRKPVKPTKSSRRRGAAFKATGGKPK